MSARLPGAHAVEEMGSVSLSVLPAEPDHRQAALDVEAAAVGDGGVGVQQDLLLGAQVVARSRGEDEQAPGE
eukprot:6852084-Lingulodinium_polyedra.AAC.1